MLALGNQLLLGPLSAIQANQHSRALIHTNKPSYPKAELVSRNPRWYCVTYWCKCSPWEVD